MLSTKRKMSVIFVRSNRKQKRRRQSPCRGWQIANATRTFGGALPISNERNETGTAGKRNNNNKIVQDEENRKIMMLERLKESEVGAYLFNGIVRNQDVQEPIISNESVAE